MKDELILKEVALDKREAKLNDKEKELIKIEKELNSRASKLSFKKSIFDFFGGAIFKYFIFAILIFVSVFFVGKIFFPLVNNIIPFVVALIASAISFSIASYNSRHYSNKDSPFDYVISFVISMLVVVGSFAIVNHFETTRDGTADIAYQDAASYSNLKQTLQEILESSDADSNFKLICYASDIYKLTSANSRSKIENKFTIEGDAKSFVALYDGWASSCVSFPRVVEWEVNL